MTLADTLTMHWIEKEIVWSSIKHHITKNLQADEFNLLAKIRKMFKTNKWLSLWLSTSLTNYLKEKLTSPIFNAVCVYMWTTFV